MKNKLAPSVKYVIKPLRKQELFNQQRELQYFWTKVSVITKA